MPAERRPAAQDSEPRHPRDLIYTNVRAGQIPLWIDDPELRVFAARAASKIIKDVQTASDIATEATERKKGPPKKLTFPQENMARATYALLTFGYERKLPYANRLVILTQLQALAEGRTPNPNPDIKSLEQNPEPISFTELETGLLENAGGIMKNTERMVAILSAIYEKNCKDSDYFSFKVMVCSQVEEISLTSGNLVDYAIRMALNQGVIDAFASGRSAKRGHTDPTCRTSDWCKHP